MYLYISIYQIIHMISEDILMSYGAKEQVYDKGDFILEEGKSARYYFQLKSGTVKMNNFSEDGKEFVQGIFNAGACFAEPPLFGDFPYPANAVAIEKSTVYVLGRDRFFDLLDSRPDLLMAMTKSFAKRMNYKAIMLAEISSNNPEHRIGRFLSYLKEDVYQITEAFGFQVKLTRQQIADLTGLRVETVIRTIKAMEKSGQLRIIDKKIYF